MPYGVTATGFNRKTVEVIRAEIKAALLAQISTELDLEDESPLGNVVGIFGSHAAELWEVLEEVYNSQYPASASGFSLRAIGSITGTVGRDPTPSTVTATVNVDAGTYAIGDLIAHTVGDPNARFFNSAPVVNAGPGAANVNVAFESEETGPVRANAGTLTVIAETVTGWNSVTNAADAVLGLGPETDAEFRVRREQERAAQGSTTPDAIKADILSVAGVTSCKVLFNDTDATDGDGLPPHSVEILVTGGTNADIANALWLSKPVGIQSYGSTSQVIQDSEGNDQTVNFSRPTSYVLEMAFTVTVGPNYAGDTALKQALADLVDSFATGQDWVENKGIATVMAMAGVEDVADWETGTSAPSVVAPVPGNFTIPVRGLATLDTSDITITTA